MAAKFENETSVQERLKQVFDALGISIYQIAKDLDENSSKFYNILNGRAKPSYDTIIRILDHYPQVSADFLLRGVQPILNGADPSNARLVANEISYVEVPFVPIKFHASFVETYTDGFRYTDLETYSVSTEAVKGLRDPIIIEISGNSMSPQLVNGAKVMVVPVDPGDWIYQSGGVFAVIYRDFFVVKRIRENELLTKRYLTLHSDNPLGGSVSVPADELRGLWRVAHIVSAPVE
ncbi:S24 family peptidase [Telluribacter sp. SYSU D00476]|uniref:S24 family peptidase n=1 Tax=Telluribacter sp. SYSU D00476 TaxID=2811430 RepID=UPI001FF16399|nr:S24 family peptidase [Telluribacter sp. SYSU D00476]